MVSVDHVSKLFEQINGNEPDGFDKRYRNNKHPAFHLIKRVFAHATGIIGSGSFRIVGLGSFVTFLAPQEK
jgi:hypothetical protein